MVFLEVTLLDLLHALQNTVSDKNQKWQSLQWCLGRVRELGGEWITKYSMLTATRMFNSFIKQFIALTRVLQKRKQTGPDSAEYIQDFQIRTYVGLVANASIPYMDSLSSVHGLSNFFVRVYKYTSFYFLSPKIQTEHC